MGPMSDDDDSPARPRGSLLAAEPAHHRSIVRRFLRHRGGHRLEIRTRRHRRVHRHDIRRLDGRVARWTHTESAFGKEYDSLSDMVSFGVAPAIVTYQWGVARIAEYGPLWRRLGWLVCFFYAAAAALRLARFNSRVGDPGQALLRGSAEPVGGRHRRGPGVARQRSRPTSACRV